MCEVDLEGIQRLEEGITKTVCFFKEGDLGRDVGCGRASENKGYLMGESG